MLRASVGMLFLTALEAAILFGAAGRWNVRMFWAYLAVVATPGFVLLPLLRRLSPGLLEERLRPGPGERDRAGTPLIALHLSIMLVVSGLDVGRFHWSGRVPLGLQVVGLVGAAIGYAFAGWALLVNPFFSSAVRVQADRRQTVVTRGPYAVVRHPGYAGSLFFSAWSAVALGSWWALLPMALLLPALVRRTALEDAMLRSELAGYADYARRVRFRLVPGLW